MNIISKRSNGSRRVVKEISGDSRTKQSFKDECDINNIMKKFRATGVATHVAKYQGDYRDVTGALDYRSSLDVVIAAQDAFDSLPSHIRQRFGNDPALFLDFVSNEANASEMVKLGLLKEPAVGAADAVPAVPTAGEQAPPVV